MRWKQRHAAYTVQVLSSFCIVTSLLRIPSCWQGDIILVGLRDYQDEKADVILK